MSKGGGACGYLCKISGKSTPLPPLTKAFPYAYAYTYIHYDIHTYVCTYTYVHTIAYNNRSIHCNHGEMIRAHTSCIIMCTRVDHVHNSTFSEWAWLPSLTHRVAVTPSIAYRQCMTWYDGCHTRIQRSSQIPGVKIESYFMELAL